MLDLSRVRALCFDVDGTLADTDDHLVQRLAALLDRLPLVSGRRAEAAARRLVMGLETPVNALYGLLDRAGLDDEVQAVRAELAAIRRLRDPARARNPEAADEVPHAMIAGVREMVASRRAGRRASRRSSPTTASAATSPPS
jgi:phosphoglycolate phosphatase